MKSETEIQENTGKGEEGAPSGDIRRGEGLREEKKSRKEGDREQNRK